MNSDFQQPEIIGHNITIHNYIIFYYTRGFVYEYVDYGGKNVIRDLQHGVQCTIEY